MITIYTFTLFSLASATVAITEEDTSSSYYAPRSNQTKLLEPTSYFQEKTRRIVDKANLISPDAVPVTNYPTIDISPWLDDSSAYYTDTERRAVVLQILEQATGSGSFNIIGHNISIDTLDRLQSSTERFFLRESITTKQKYALKTEAIQSGYISFGNEALSKIHETNNTYEQVDLREIYATIYPPSYSENILAPDYFQSVMSQYMEHLQPVEYALESILSEALQLKKGMSDDINLHTQSTQSTGMMKASHYPAMPVEYDDANANRLLAHSDWSSLTIIYSQEEGLEEIRDGRWVKVPMGKDELHVSIGELFTVWSNELFTNNVHRVSNRAANDRLSFAYFSGQGQKDGSKYMEPVVSADGREEPKFPIWSTITQMESYIKAL